MGWGCRLTEIAFVDFPRGITSLVPCNSRSCHIVTKNLHYRCRSIRIQLLNKRLPIALLFLFLFTSFYSKLFLLFLLSFSCLFSLECLGRRRDNDSLFWLSTN